MISVIIPVYNGEEFLSHSINAILGQSYTDLEILLVDDGSTDATGTLCDEFARKDTRCRVLHKKNEGAWSAKNAGLDAASGEFVTFVDSDDYCHPGMIRLLYDAICREPSCDFAMAKLEQVCAYDKVFSNCLEFSPCIQTREWLLSGLFSEKRIAFSVMPGKLYRAELVKDIRCGHYFMTEDFDFNLKVFLKARNVAFVNQPLYYWVQRGNSLTHMSEARYDGFDREVRITRDAYSQLSSENKRFGQLLLNHLYNNLSNWINDAFQNGEGIEYSKRCRAYQKGMTADYLSCKEIPLFLRVYNIERIYFPVISQWARKLFSKR